MLPPTGTQPPCIPREACGRSHRAMGLSEGLPITVPWSFVFTVCALFALWIKGGRDELQAYIFISALLFVFITLNVTNTGNL